MFGGVKITLILCATMIVCCVLVISYNEYTNRYTLLTNGDNSIYIFDKKSTVLNKCDGKTCSTIETKLPAQTHMGFEPTFQQSRMFDTTNRPMTSEVNEKMPEAPQVAEKKGEAAKVVEAKPTAEQSKSEKETTENPEKESSKAENLKTENSEKGKDTPEKTSPEAKGEQAKEKPNDTEKSSDDKANADDEFVE